MSPVTSSICWRSCIAHMFLFRYHAHLYPCTFMRLYQAQKVSHSFDFTSTNAFKIYNQFFYRT
jgi:hypothetical protein